MKIALCFLISYDHCLKKEQIWLDWIKPNSDIINVYFHYKSYDKISSPFIKKHVIPLEYIRDTSYFYVVPAYMSIMMYAYNHDKENQWFSMLTDSCVPIISPQKFRRLFFQNYSYSLLRWKKPWWNVYLSKRANLFSLEEKYRLGHDPWFILKRENVMQCINYVKAHPFFYNTICNGGLANESIFAILLVAMDQLKYVKNEITHITDWDRPSSDTSPHVFKVGCIEDVTYISKLLNNNKYAMFLRKVDSSFPDDVLLDFINAPDFDKNNMTEYLTRLGIFTKKYLFLFAIFTVISFSYFNYFAPEVTKYG